MVSAFTRGACTLHPIRQGGHEDPCTAAAKPRVTLAVARQQATHWKRMDFVSTITNNNKYYNYFFWRILEAHEVGHMDDHSRAERRSSRRNFAENTACKLLPSPDKLSLRLA